MLGFLEFLNFGFGLKFPVFLFIFLLIKKPAIKLLRGHNILDPYSIIPKKRYLVTKKKLNIV